MSKADATQVRRTGGRRARGADAQPQVMDEIRQVITAYVAYVNDVQYVQVRSAARSTAACFGAGASPCCDRA